MTESFHGPTWENPLEHIIEPLDMSTEEFIAVCDQFTNKKIFITDSDGKLMKDKYVISQD